jgi:hypothetical protein
MSEPYVRYCKLVHGIMIKYLLFGCLTKEACRMRTSVLINSFQIFRIESVSVVFFGKWFIIVTKNEFHL